MSTAELGRILIVLLRALAILAALAAAVILARRFLERRVRSAMAAHVGSLVGKRALVVSDLRAGRPGLIRLLESPDRKIDPEATFPAMANQLISRGRVVRVTGGDAEGYLVQPLKKER